MYPLSRETRLENKRVREGKERKGAAEYFGANLTPLLNLVQVTDAQDLPPVWEDLARASKHQQLLVLQRAFDRTAEEMGLCAPPTSAGTVSRWWGRRGPSSAVPSNDR